MRQRHERRMYSNSKIVVWSVGETDVVSWLAALMAARRKWPRWRSSGRGVDGAGTGRDGDWRKGGGTVRCVSGW